MIILIQCDFEVTDNMIAVFFNHLNQRMNRGIQVIILHLSAFKHVLDRDRVCQFVVSQQISVPVINTATASCNRPFLFDLHLEGIDIVLTMYNLKIKHTVNHSASDHQEHENQNKFPGGNHIQKLFF